MLPTNKRYLWSLSSAYIAHFESGWTRCTRGLGWTRRWNMGGGGYVPPARRILQKALCRIPFHWKYKEIQRFRCSMFIQSYVVQQTVFRWKFKKYRLLIFKQHIKLIFIWINKFVPLSEAISATEARELAQSNRPAEHDNVAQTHESYFARQKCCASFKRFSIKAFSQ